jgi:hypothetical protein
VPGTCILGDRHLKKVKIAVEKLQEADFVYSTFFVAA